MREQPDHTSLSNEAFLNHIEEKAFRDYNGDLERVGLHYLSKPPSWRRSMIQSLQLARPHLLWACVLRVGLAFLPSIAQPKVCSDRSKSDKLSSTAYLDGMRGLAALFVFLCHYSYTSFVITAGYGYGKPEENRNWLQLPIVRLIYSGPPMVCLFFVISGYALSFKPVKQMRSRSWDSLFTTMTSSIFRRAIRLFLPTVISTLMVVTMLRLGLYETTRDFASNKDVLRNVIEHHPARLPTFAAQLHDWGWKALDFVHIWGWEQYGGSTDYDVHLWTIPVEFRCSMVLFLVLIGLARVKPWLRIFFLTMIAWFSFVNNRWEVILFLGGMLLAEIDIIATEAALERSTPLKQADLHRRHFWWAMLSIVALYLMSQPDHHFEETPGWIWLSKLIPNWFVEKYRFWQCVGSILFVLAVNSSTVLQTPFNLPIVQYFGKISYALYLMHGPVTHAFGYRVEQWAWSITGLAPGTQYISGWILAGIFNIPLVIWVSDVFWRLCDTPTVRFARWVESKCLSQHVT